MKTQRLSHLTNRAYGCVRLDSNQRSSAHEADEMTTSPLRNIWQTMMPSAMAFKGGDVRGAPPVARTRNLSIW